MEENPWLNGCYELLKHGIDHFLNDTEFDRRIAMITIDNALELSIKTYISRNLRVLNIKRKDFNNFKQDFLKLLNMISKIAPDKISNQELSSIEHNHELRNNLYHEGIGITVNKEIVKQYAKEVISLISKLYEVDLGNLINKLGIFKYIKKINILWKEWRRYELDMLIFVLNDYIESDLTREEQVSMLLSKGIISIAQGQFLLKINNLFESIHSKSEKLSIQEFRNIDDMIARLKEINNYFADLNKKEDNKRREDRKKISKSLGNLIHELKKNN